jgi:phosphopantothenoylcysteine decarboxylase/phosphopantothenate--cysteine ligase
MMQKRQIVIGITGGIAAYKTATLVSRLTQRGYDVHVIMTEASCQFITPLTLQTLSRNPVAVDTFDECNPEVVNHIDLADRADLFVIAPATANLIAKMAHGLADDMLSTTLLATQAPIAVAPAMNVHMYDHPAVQENLQRLRQRGVYLLEPGEGPLACGYVGKGRMAEPEDILEWMERFFSLEQTLKGQKVLVTAGPTIEPLDPVRFFSNFSSGKMGYAMAEAAAEIGAEVVLISGPVSLSEPQGVQVIHVRTAEEMYQQVMEQLPQSDIVVKAAAVSDYRPQVVQPQKIKKNQDILSVELEKTVDIAAEVGRRKRPDQLLIGFAAETQQVAEYAQGKLERKGMDWIVANDVSEEGAGFGTDTNRVTLYARDGQTIALPKMNKGELARQIWSAIKENSQ